MSYKVGFKKEDCLKMNPLELVNMLEKEMIFDIPNDVIGQRNMSIASTTITKATSYETYFTEMETRARLMKKIAKAAKNTDEYNRLMGVEDVFKSFKEIAKMQVENVAKLMTLRRLELDDMRMNGNSNIT